MNPYVPRSKVVIYNAAEQGIDAETKFAVVCDAHATIGAATTLRSARCLMKSPADFCRECQEILAEGS